MHPPPTLEGAWLNIKKRSETRPNTQLGLYNSKPLPSNRVTDSNDDGYEEKKITSGEVWRTPNIKRLVVYLDADKVPEPNPPDSVVVHQAVRHLAHPPPTQS